MKFQIGKLFDNKRFLIFFSIVMAIVAWIIVVKTIDPVIEETVKNVEIDVGSSQTDELQYANLSIIEGTTAKVNVRVKGERYIVGSLVPADIDLKADLSGISSPGTFDVTLTGKSRYKEFEVVEVSPAKVRIRVDRLKTKNFDITASVEGLQIPEEYLGPEEALVSPKQVSIKGPEADIQKISRCVVSAKFNEPLVKNTTVTSMIVLYDVDGNEIMPDGLSLDVQSADITIPILKQKRLGVVFEYSDIPLGFPINNLDYTVSPGYIDVAGPEVAVDALNKLNIGYIPVNEISQDSNFMFNVDLPEGFRNISDVKAVNVEFNTGDLVAMKFSIPGENIYIKNQPVDYGVKLNSQGISDVVMLGDRDVIETLSAKDIIAEIDLSEREISPGPFSMPVHISLPGKEFAWATGKYTAVVTITERK